jgi:hypothetical protein
VTVLNVKIFDGGVVRLVEARANEFLQTLPPEKIKQIRPVTSPNHGGWFYLIILYEEVKE